MAYPLGQISTTLAGPTPGRISISLAGQANILVRWCMSRTGEIRRRTAVLVLPEVARLNSKQQSPGKTYNGDEMAKREAIYNIAVEEMTAFNTTPSAASTASRHH